MDSCDELIMLHSNITKYCILLGFFSGTIVMRLNATDADEPNNLNSKIAFKIISQSPSSAFSMNKDTGEVQVATINLDREVKKKKKSIC